MYIAKIKEKPIDCLKCRFARIDINSTGQFLCMMSRDIIEDLRTGKLAHGECPITELTECRDCIRFKPISDGYGECNRQGATLTVKADDFCSAAERRQQ